MKRFLIAVLGLVVFAALGGVGLAQGNPRGISKLDLKGKVVSVEYGRPSLRGRTVQQLLEQLKRAISGAWARTSPQPSPPGLTWPSVT